MKTKALVLTDLHLPFHRPELILPAIEKHEDADFILFGGDIVDCESISKFPKEGRKPLAFEMAVTNSFLRKIDIMTPKSKKVVIKGNHEARFEKYLAEKANELNSLHGNNVLLEIAKGFTYHDKDTGEETEYSPLSDNYTIVDKWFYQLHDLIIAHPAKKPSNQQVKTATRTVEHFLKRGFDFNACFIGHTHQWGVAKHYSKYCGELGCLCREFDYADQGNISFSPQDYGYGVFVFNDGKISIDASEIKLLSIKEGE
jgi:predicted phosphodiesterase